MNWLAHLLLSEPTAEFRLGNLLPDLLSTRELEDFPDEFRRGIECHRRIDAFTDRHPLFGASRDRLRPSFGRLAAVAVDVFYDHLLAAEWEQYARVPLRRFADEVYAEVGAALPRIPPHARIRLERMCEHDWIVSYRRISGVQFALQRIGERLRKPLDLGGAVHALAEEFGALQGDFRAFFPQLRAHVLSSGVDARLAK